MEKTEKKLNFLEKSKQHFLEKDIIRNEQSKKTKAIKYILITEKFICPKCKRKITVFTDHKIEIKKLHVCK